MSSIRNCKSVGVLALAVLAVCFNTSRASAQDFHGKFTLPVETRWGAATLPPGEYSIILDNHTVEGTVRLNSSQKNPIILPQIIDHRRVPGDTGLICERSGGRLNVRMLYIKPLDLVLSYPWPGSARNVVAQAAQLIQRVPITAGR